MIKRILVTLVLLAAPLFAAADTSNRAFLLTNDGTLFTIESAYTDEMGVQSSSTQVLVLTVRNDSTASTAIVPETLLGGSHTNPALAYDAVSKSLFIFWQRQNGMSSDLVFCSYENGKWSEATSVDSALPLLAQHPDCGHPQNRSGRREGQSQSSVNGLTVHAVWWEETGRKRVGALRDAEHRERPAERHPDRRPLALHEHLEGRPGRAATKTSTPRSSAIRRSSNRTPTT
jgi:hypothetical protein